MSHACLWANGKATVLGLIKEAGWEDITATACAINDKGDIVGTITPRMNFGQAVLWSAH